MCLIYVFLLFRLFESYAGCIRCVSRTNVNIIVCKITKFFSDAKIYLENLYILCFVEQEKQLCQDKRKIRKLICSTCGFSVCP